MEYIKLAPLVNAIARKAGAVIMNIYQNEADFQVEAKGDDSPLTRADREANALICRELEKLPRQFPIISEENKEIPYEIRKGFSEHWLIDPLDGTKEFIKRNGEFTVNIALVKDQELQMGVVYAPVLEELYWAVRGEGAWLEKGGNKQKLEAAPFRMTDTGLGVVCSRSHLNEETQAFINGLQEPEKVQQGSSLKFLVLARGRAQLYPRLAPTMEWDTGAAQMILEEAGGKVINQENGAPLRYNKEHLRNPHFIAYGKVLEG